MLLLLLQLPPVGKILMSLLLLAPAGNAVAAGAGC